MNFTAYYTVSQDRTLSTDTEEILDYVAAHPRLFVSADPFPTEADAEEQGEDFLGLVHTWLEDNSVIFENFSTEEANESEYAVETVEEG